MSIALSSQLQTIRENAREVAGRVTSQYAAQHDREYSMPVETLSALHKAKLLAISTPKRLGGMETGMVNCVEPLAFLLVIEELARVDMSAAHCFQVHSHSSQLLASTGTEQQQDRWFAPVMKDGGIISWTGGEPGRTARGQYSMISEAQRKNGGYVLNGIKQYGTNASIGAWNIVSVSLPDLPEKDGFLMVLIPRGAKGFEVDESWWRPTGMRACVSPKIALKDLYIPDEDVLQKPGFYPGSKLGARWHLGFSASHLGASQGLLDFVLEYLPKRGTTGNPHSQRAVGEMKMRIAAARNMVYHAAELWAAKQIPEAEEYSLMAKLYAISTAEWMVNETIRVVGSTALLETYPLSRMIRDIHVHSTHANLHNTAQSIGRAALGLSFDSTEQQ
jgi:alkylation response protein AidB-like acyl-CoA dehydrogenase